MKITQITAENILGIAHIDVALSKPVALFAGDNYAGKSSLREAIKLALIGVPERVLKKKDYVQIVHDTAETGVASVEFENDGSAYFTAPAGKQELKHSYTMDTFERMALAMPSCLEIDTFGKASTDERRSLLFAITGASAKTSDIVASLKAKGLGDKLVETVTPLLRSGFPAAAEFAAGKARDAKSDWKAVTHEAYGHVKAETWTAPVPAGVDTTAIEQLQAKAEILKGKIGTEQTRLGAAEQRLKAWLQHTANYANDQKAAARLPALNAKLGVEQKDLAKWEHQVQELTERAGTGPRSGLVHDLARALHYFLTFDDIDPELPEDQTALTVMAAYEQQYGKLGTEGDADAKAQLPEAQKALALMRSAVSNTQRDIDAAKAAEARLGQPHEKGSEEQVESIATILKGYQQEHQEVSAELARLQAEQRAAAAAVEATAKAKAHHEAVKQWQIAIDALSPDGIPAEILGKALVPLNNMLAMLSKTFCWLQVQVDADMMITSGKRPYALQSESEKWRTDAILAMAIANISGLKLAAFDRVDVLNICGRTDLIDGLDQLAEQGFIDTALLFGTFKQLPTVGGFPLTAAFWIENGTIATKQEAIKEAA